MIRLLLIALLLVGLPALVLAQDKEDGPAPRLVALQQDKDKDKPEVKDPPKDPPKEEVKKETPAAKPEVFVETPHWSRRVPLDLVQVAMSVIIAALLGLAVSQLSGLKSSIDKLADKMGGGGS